MSVCVCEREREWRERKGGEVSMYLKLSHPSQLSLNLCVCVSERKGRVEGGEYVQCT